jgi:hypothetical protein
LRKSFLVSVLITFLCSLTAAADPFPKDEAAKSLIDQIGSFKGVRAPGPVERRDAELTTVTSAARREYRSDSGQSAAITIAITGSDAAAYSAFLGLVSRSPQQHMGVEVGTRSIVLPNEIVFFKGPNLITIESHRRFDPNTLLEFARTLAQNLSNGEGDIPVLVKHLPHWEQVESRASYAVTPAQLKSAMPGEPVLDAVSFEGGAEAVVAPYGNAKMVLVEFTTPQLATDNDQKILASLQQLRTEGKATPTAYRRVGNYGVFVFGADSEQSANQLIEEIKYEQVVQWLGDNPNWLKQAQKEYTETTLGVLVTVIKTSGIAAVICFGVGGFLGAILFARRRAQQIEAKAYSDAGGLMRLNLDEMTGQANSTKLIGPVSEEN